MTGLVQSLGTPFSHTVLVEYPLQERHERKDDGSLPISSPNLHFYQNSYS
jgi:hypothetical protein